MTVTAPFATGERLHPPLPAKDEATAPHSWEWMRQQAEMVDDETEKAQARHALENSSFEACRKPSEDMLTAARRLFAIPCARMACPECLFGGTPYTMFPEHAPDGESEHIFETCYPCWHHIHAVEVKLSRTTWKAMIDDKRHLLLHRYPRPMRQKVFRWSVRHPDLCRFREKLPQRLW